VIVPKELLVRRLANRCLQSSSDIQDHEKYSLPASAARTNEGSERGGVPGPPVLDENDSRGYHFTFGAGPILSWTAGVVVPPGKEDSHPVS
jgi:hypothetical protein